MSLIGFEDSLIKCVFKISQPADSMHFNDRAEFPLNFSLSLSIQSGQQAAGNISSQTKGSH